MPPGHRRPAAVPGSQAGRAAGDRLAGEHDLAGDLAVVQVADEGEAVGQEGGGLDLDLQGARGGLVGQVRHVLDALAGGDAGEDPEAGDGDALAVELLDPEGRGGVGRVAVDHHPAAGRGRVQQRAHHGAADAVHDRVELALDGGAVAGVDDGLGPGGADRGRPLLAARLAGHGGLGLDGELDREQPDPAGRPGDQHPVAGMDPGQAQDAHGGDPRHRQGGRAHEVAGRRQGGGPLGRHHDLLGEGAAGRGQGHHPLAHVEGGHALAQGGHRPGHVPADDRARRLLGRRPDLAPVDRGRLHVEQELAGPGGRLGDVGEGQGGRGRGVGHECAHGPSLLRRFVPSIPPAHLPINSGREVRRYAATAGSARPWGWPWCWARCSGSAGGVLEQAMALAYPVGDVVLATVVFVVVARIRVGGAPVLLPGAGLLGLAVADTGFAYLTQEGTYRTGVPTDVGWFLGYLLVAAAARRPAAVGITWVGRRPGQVQILLPYCPLALAVATSVTLQPRGERTGPFLYWTFVALVLLIVGPPADHRARQPGP